MATIDGKCHLKVAPGKFNYFVVLGGDKGCVEEVGPLAQINVNMQKEATESSVVVPMLPPLEFPARRHDFLDILVSHVEGGRGERVYVQLRNKSTALAEMSGKLQKIYGRVDAKNEQCYNPDKGQLCVAKYANDNNWYRASVVQRKNRREIEVFFVDYGNKATVDKEDVRVLKDAELWSIPPQALAVCLRHVGPIKVSLDQIQSRLADHTGVIQISAVRKPTYDVLEVDLGVEVKGKIIKVSEVMAGREGWPDHYQQVPDLVPDVPTQQMPPHSKFMSARQPQQGFSDSRSQPNSNVDWRSREMPSGDGGGVRSFGEQQNRTGAFSGGGAFGGRGGFGDKQQDRGFGDRSSRPPLSCYNCSEAGHMSRDCSKPQKPRMKSGCFHCGEEGHRKIDCPKLQGGGEGAAVGFGAPSAGEFRRSND